jgi:CheY-like chemotaxis protein
MAERRILIVEDDPAASGPMEAALQGAGYRTRAAASQSEALAGAEEFDPHVILMDVSLGEAGDGIDTAQLMNQKRETPVIYVTAHDDESTFARALATTPFAFLEKPIRIPKLLRTIEMALAQRQKAPGNKGVAAGAQAEVFTPLFNAATLGTFAPEQAVCAIFDLHYYALIATRYSKGVADEALLKLATILKDFFQEVEKNFQEAEANNSCKASFYRIVKPRIAAVIEGNAASLGQVPALIQQFMASRRNQLVEVTSSGSAMVSMSASYKMLRGTDPAGWLGELQPNRTKEAVPPMNKEPGAPLESRPEA